MKFKNTEYLRAALLGVTVGDALGVPYEFRTRDTFRVTGMSEGGAHGQVRGTWSDDSSLMLATLESLVECERLDGYDLMDRFSLWARGKAYCPHGECFDIGFGTARAIMAYEDGTEPTSCGGHGERDNGNGSLMRILPIAFVEHTERDVFDLSSLTHAHEISLRCCRIYVALAEQLMAGMEKTAAVASLTGCINECARIHTLAELPRDQIRSSGYVVDTLEAAIWCLLHTESYQECLITAVELGEDTDTVGAVAGGLAGIYYGIGKERGIPEEWISPLSRLDWLEELFSRAIQKGEGAAK